MHYNNYIYIGCISTIGPKYYTASYNILYKYSMFNISMGQSTNRKRLTCDSYNCG